MKTLLIKAITLYQNTLVPHQGWPGLWHPTGVCRLQPTCSEYVKQSIEQHGVIRGVFLGMARVSRCHPWAAPGIDLVLNKQTN
ncbi:hypothetical protein A3K24_02010 [candidate division Kazan bacterium RIFCSPHIGHO2_01_FULL_44_14]|uniref:Putative membrane protein insertion efficiency factor n=1 Tax=candidate division Kazan bacterium RIFCSPLOWO2_01_FULL_45_19 TaxID=1798538 RepID=A0A1F4NQ77_UNCK3|nr:MAG: hypothetical protein A3K51_02010 [candidate division Kazan bacterium RIFCSPLOWO2_01_FULL_45_19]OGB77846.1 MAG: hypothetical protein A3K24_02010 [candidate division Kazan bacterium RIFCSPHIGHO2_01_FULL_44_14]